MLHLNCGESGRREKPPCDPFKTAQNRTDVTPDTRPRLPVSCKMSAGAPRGLASSGQKPIAEIVHPLSAAEEPLSITVSAGGDKVDPDGPDLTL